MNQKKDKMKRRAKTTVFLLSAVMAVSLVPAAVYAAENEILVEEVSGNSDISVEDVNAKAGEHVHNWSYVNDQENKQEIIATCKGDGCDVGAEGMRLTLKVEKDSNSKIRAAVSANGVELLRDNDWKIGYQIKYFDRDNKDIGEDAPQEDGEYRTQAKFGDDENPPYLETTYKIIDKKVEQTLTVKMGNYMYGAGNVAGPSLSEEAVEPKTIEYHYYDENGEKLPELGEFDSTSFDAGTYYVSAEYTLASNEDYIYTTGKTKFEVEKGDLSEITVSMNDYALEQGKKPSPKLNGELKEKSEVVYYYNKKNKNTNGTKWADANPTKGTYYMYAVIGETSNYKGYTTTTQKFTVSHREHEWKMPSKLIQKEQTISCKYCNKKSNVTLPKKTVSVVMGKKSVNLGSNCTFKEVKQDYFLLSKKGKVTTKANPAYYKNMKPAVSVNVTANGKTYKMTVNLKIPAPKAVITHKKITSNGEPGYRFEFSYKIPGANKIQVWMPKFETEEINKTQDINNYFKKYFSNPRPANKPFINLSESSLEKIDNGVTFYMRAYYGSNKSEIFEKRIWIE